jgi:hypothetical protein
MGLPLLGHPREFDGTAPRQSVNCWSPIAPFGHSCPAALTYSIPQTSPIPHSTSSGTSITSSSTPSAAASFPRRSTASIRFTSVLVSQIPFNFTGRVTNSHNLSRCRASLYSSIRTIFSLAALMTPIAASLNRNAPTDLFRTIFKELPVSWRTASSATGPTLTDNRSPTHATANAGLFVPSGSRSFGMTFSASRVMLRRVNSPGILPICIIATRTLKPMSF